MALTGFERTCEVVEGDHKPLEISEVIAGFLGKLPKGHKVPSKPRYCGKIAHSWIHGRWHCQSHLADLMNRGLKDDPLEVPVPKSPRTSTSSSTPIKGVQVCTGYVSGRKVSSSEASKK